MRAVAVVALLSVVGSDAAAEPPATNADANADITPPKPTEVPTARPVIPIDDTRSYGPTARNWFDIGATQAVLLADGGATYQLTSQLSIGFPRVPSREVSDVYARYDLTSYQFRIRDEVFAGAEHANGGPMTFAVQRYFPISQLAISPLVFAHVGVEAAISTPWLSGSDAVPIRAIYILDGPDTELADNGWSLRPAAVYFRGDFLACRSESIDIGIEPEAFVPVGRVREYGTRFHVAAGVSLGCHGNMSPHAPKITVEYRGRIRMYAGDSDVAYRDNLAAGIQYDFGPLALQAFYKADPGQFAAAAAFGLRLQIGKENRPQ